MANFTPNCPFIYPITEAEVDLYREYLSQGEVELKDELTFCYFQDYDGIKEAYLSEGEEGSHYFAWYEFYNSRKGTAHYMNLPDIRGDKEASYITLARSTNPEKAAAIAAMKAAFTHSPDEPYIDRDGRELLNAYSPETLSFFVNSFEDQQTKEYYKAAAWFTRNNEEREILDTSIELLLSADEEIAIEEHHNWKEAIHQAARRYTIRKISEMLTEAYEHYQMNIAMNIAFPEKNTDHLKAAKESIVADILLGRKLSREPEDLNF